MNRASYEHLEYVGRGVYRLKDKIFNSLLVNDLPRLPKGSYEVQQFTKRIRVKLQTKKAARDFADRLTATYGLKFATSCDGYILKGDDKVVEPITIDWEYS